MVEVNVSHLFPGLDKVRLLRSNVTQHAERLVDGTTSQGQVHISYSEPDFLAAALKVIDGVLHNLSRFMLAHTNTLLQQQQQQQLLLLLLLLLVLLILLQQYYCYYCISWSETMFLVAAFLNSFIRSWSCIILAASCWPRQRHTLLQQQPQEQQQQMLLLLVTTTTTALTIVSWTSLLLLLKSLMVFCITLAISC